MFSSFLIIVTVLASVHSFIAVAATPEPSITAAPIQKRGETIANGSPTDPILSTQTFAFDDLPEQVNPWPSIRGPQSGYNICNSTTGAIPFNKCQTVQFNDIDDFCFWGSPVPNGNISDIEASVVAWCTKATHGANLISPGSITGVQFMITPEYVQVVGFMNLEGVALNTLDPGGELDPHGADLRGNPLGGVVYSTNAAVPGAANNTPVQITEWNQFIGNGGEGGVFCFKACFQPSVAARDELEATSEESLCINTLDLLGCQYNMPNNAKNDSFVRCHGDTQDPAGVYTGPNGEKTTYAQPPTLTTQPNYTPRIPSSSNCQTFQSTDLYGQITTSAEATGTGSASSGSSGSSRGSGTLKGSQPTGKSSSALSSIGFPPALYTVGLAMMAGVALVL